MQEHDEVFVKFITGELSSPRNNREDVTAVYRLKQYIGVKSYTKMTELPNATLQCHVENYVKYHLAKVHDNRTIEKYIKKLKSFFDENLVKLDFEKIRDAMPDIRDITGVSFTDKEVQKMYDIMDNSRRNDIVKNRNLAMLSFLCASGLKPRQLLSLQIRDLKPNESGGFTVSIRGKSKGYNEESFDFRPLLFTTFVNSQTRELVERYLKEKNLDGKRFAVFDIGYFALIKLFQRLVDKAECRGVKRSEEIVYSINADIYEGFRKRYESIALKNNVEKGMICHLLGVNISEISETIPAIDVMYGNYNRMCDKLTPCKKGEFIDT